MLDLPNRKFLSAPGRFDRQCDNEHSFIKNRFGSAPIERCRKIYLSVKRSPLHFRTLRRCLFLVGSPSFAPFTAGTFGLFWVASTMSVFDSSFAVISKAIGRNPAYLHKNDCSEIRLEEIYVDRVRPVRRNFICGLDRRRVILFGRGSVARRAIGDAFAIGWSLAPPAAGSSPCNFIDNFS